MIHRIHTSFQTKIQHFFTFGSFTIFGCILHPYLVLYKYSCISPGPGRALPVWHLRISSTAVGTVKSIARSHIWAHCFTLQSIWNGFCSENYWWLYTLFDRAESWLKLSTGDLLLRGTAKEKYIGNSLRMQTGRVLRIEGPVLYFWIQVPPSDWLSELTLNSFLWNQLKKAAA